MPSTATITTKLNPVERARAEAFNYAACQRLTRELEQHATALKSWAQIALDRMHSPRALTAGTAQLLRDVAAAIETEASICAGLARKLRQEARR